MQLHNSHVLLMDIKNNSNSNLKESCQTGKNKKSGKNKYYKKNSNVCWQNKKQETEKKIEGGAHNEPNCLCSKNKNHDCIKDNGFHNTSSARNTISLPPTTSSQAHVQSWPKLPSTCASTCTKSDSKAVTKEQSLCTPNNNYVNKNKNSCVLSTEKKFAKACATAKKLSCAEKSVHSKKEHFKPFKEIDQKEICENNNVQLYTCSSNLSMVEASVINLNHSDNGISNHASISSKSKKSENSDEIKTDRLTRKLKQLQIKEEKTRKREEEVRRRMIAPKSQHFKIIDSSVMDKIRADATDSGKSKNVKLCTKTSTFDLNRQQSEFPDLGTTGLKLKDNYNSRSEPLKYNGQSLDQNDLNRDCLIEAKCRSDKVAKQINNHENTIIKNITTSIENSAIEKDDFKIFKECKDIEKSTNNNSNSIKKKKKVKKNDPIEINIISALKVQKKKQEQATNFQFVKKFPKKKQLLSGNELDSDAPMRRRGKYRENKTKKLSKIKRIILNERQSRNQLMNESKLKLLNLNKLVLCKNLDQNDIYYHLLDKNQFRDRMHSVRKHDNTADGNDYGSINPKLLIHSRKFGYYCDQWPTKEMCKNVGELIKTVVKFQDRHYKNDPIKALAKRRYVCGFYEVLRNLNINKVKLVIIATDVECGESEGGLRDYICKVVRLSEALAVPYVFCDTKWNLKNLFKKKSPISCAGILHYNGAEEFYKNIICLLSEVKHLYVQKLKEAEVKCGIRRHVEEDVTSMCIKSMLKSLKMSDGDDNNKKTNHCKKNKNSGDNEIESDDCDLQEEDKREEVEQCPFMAAIIRCSKH